jgi:hypothetical protein
MGALRGAGRFSWIAVGVILIVAVALTACGGVITSPGGPSGTGVSDAAKALVVPDSVRAQMFQIMKNDGIVVSNEIYVFMNYDSSAKVQINVTGSFQGPKGMVKGAPLVYYTKGMLTKSGNTWKLSDVR